MKKKKETPVKVLFRFAGEAKGRMTLSVILAVLGELFGMAPFFAVAMLAGQVYGGTATVQSAALIAGAAAVCMALRAYLTMKSSLRSHRISFPILKNIRRAIADKMRRVPMGVMLETPSGAFKTLLVDNVGRLEDIIAHMIPELPSNIAAPLAGIRPAFPQKFIFTGGKMGLTAKSTGAGALCSGGVLQIDRITADDKVVALTRTSEKARCSTV